jgi:hypothetical protein
MGDVIGIFDMERVTVNSPADKFLRDSQKTGRIYYVSLDLPKSFVVTAADESELVFVSNVATLTLRKRNSRLYSAKYCRRKFTRNKQRKSP